MQSLRQIRQNNKWNEKESESYLSFKKTKQKNFLAFSSLINPFFFSAEISKNYMYV